LDASVPFKLNSLRSTSKEQGVYDQLRQAIVSGALPPGQRLIPADIGAQLGVSSMPVRNALMRLEAELLVVRAPHREYIVATCSAREIEDLFAIRAVLDSFAVRLAASRLLPEGLQELRKILAKSEEYLARGDIDSLIHANGEFHTALYRQSGNEQLFQIIQSLRDRSSRIRASHSTVETVQEHRDIVAALERGDPDAAEAIMRKDMENSGRALTEHIMPRNEQ
jgi:DNA-binding GntR family transcriptional regulator